MKGFVRWYWLIVALVIGLRGGMDLQKHWDYQVMAIMNETINGCATFMNNLEHGSGDSDSYHLI